MSQSQLSVDVYVTPMRRFNGTPAQGPGDEPTWSPMSSTMIAGAEEGMLVDALLTNDRVDELAEWVRGFDKRITGVYITHGHSDHWMGLARLQKHFPEARGIAPRTLSNAPRSRRRTRDYPPTGRTAFAVSFRRALFSLRRSRARSSNWHLARASSHCALCNRIGIGNEEFDPDRAAAERLGAKVAVLRRFVGNEERRTIDGQFSDHVTVWAGKAH